MTRHIVSFSGGKDSTAMLLMMLEHGMPVDEIRFFDTGWEFPAMHDHIAQVEAYTGLKITKLCADPSLTYLMLEHPVKGKDGQVYKNGYGWPSPFRRWCTSHKNEKLYKNVPRDSFWYIGFAADEGGRAKRLAQKNKFARFPLVDWGITEDDALRYCLDRGFDWSGLYKHFRRVSCFCCPLQRVGDLRSLRQHYPELWRQMLDWDAKMTPPRRYREEMYLPDLDARFEREEAIEAAQYRIPEAEVEYGIEMERSED